MELLLSACSTIESHQSSAQINHFIILNLSFFILTTGISIVFHGTSTDITTTTIGLVPSSTLRVKIYLACDLYLLKIARPEFVFQEKGLEGASNMNF